jgi:hypothetical protein
MDSILARQPPVEQDQIPFTPLQANPSQAPVRDVLDVISFLGQAPNQEFGDADFVFNQQDIHAHFFSLSSGPVLSTPGARQPAPIRGGSREDPTQAQAVSPYV